MERNAVGFYWTLPVPWVGFTTLPDDIDEAAKKSRTIRYQRDLIQHYARGERYRLIYEEVFLEIGPDRGSRLIVEPLNKVKAICQRQNAVLLYVDFWEVQGWRTHHALRNWLDRAGIEVLRSIPTRF